MANGGLKMKVQKDIKQKVTPYYPISVAVQERIQGNCPRAGQAYLSHIFLED